MGTVLLGRAAGLISIVLPLIGLIRLDALAADDDDDTATIIRASALRHLAAQLCQHIDEARGLADQLATVMADRRSTSQVPMMFEHLTGLGALRSSQLATILSATRLGVAEAPKHPNHAA